MTATKSPRPRRKLAPVTAPIPFRRPVRCVPGTFVNALEDQICIERWHIVTLAQPGETCYLIDRVFLGTLAEVGAEVAAWDKLIESARTWDAAARPATTAREDLPCAA